MQSRGQWDRIGSLYLKRKTEKVKEEKLYGKIFQRKYKAIVLLWLLPVHNLKWFLILVFWESILWSVSPVFSFQEYVGIKKQDFVFWLGMWIAWENKIEEIKLYFAQNAFCSEHILCPSSKD